MRDHTLYTSKYGMAVPAAGERGFELRQMTSLRWRHITAAMRQVVDGARIDHDELSVLSIAPSGPNETRSAGDVTVPTERRVLSIGR